jgi:hypothetical protein
MEEIIAAAQSAGLDFLITSDHNRLTDRQYSFQRRYGNLLVICGYELTFRRFTKNHVLVVGVPGSAPYSGRPYFERMRRIRADGGKLFIAHPWNLFKPWLLQFHLGWSKFPPVHFDGLEIWSFMHDWVGSLKPTKLLHQYHRPFEFLRGPSAKLLKRWDRMNMARPVVAIGTLDNHARKVPFSRKVIFSHELAFNSVLTFVATEEFSGDVNRDVRALIDAIAAGNSYVANNSVGDARGFQFFAQAGERRASAGQSLEFWSGVTFRVVSPLEADFTLIRNGGAVASCRSNEIDFEAPGPGLYRLEGRIASRPWLFTNHIRLNRPGGASSV